MQYMLFEMLMKYKPLEEKKHTFCRHINAIENMTLTPLNI